MSFFWKICLSYWWLDFYLLAFGLFPICPKEKPDKMEFKLTNLVESLRVDHHEAEDGVLSQCLNL